MKGYGMIYFELHQEAMTIAKVKRRHDDHNQSD
jgi:hypothetical protein